MSYSKNIGQVALRALPLIISLIFTSMIFFLFSSHESLIATVITKVISISPGIAI